MSLLQKIIILLNFKPFTLIFKRFYAFGLKRLIVRLKRHPSVHSAFGCGSFFEGACLYGLSDIDMILVIDEPYTRADEDPYQVTETYNRVRRFFPFLGNWPEKAENMIFLSEVRAGFPLPESFALRWKQKRLFHLFGKSFPNDWLGDSVTLSEGVTEMDTLLRMALTKGEIHTSNLLFWKRIFSKFIALVETLEMEGLAEEIRTDPKMAFLKTSEILLFILKSKPEELFESLIHFTREAYDRIRKSEDPLPFACAVPENQASPAEIPSNPTLPRSKALTDICKTVEVQLTAGPSLLFGIVPRLNYFPMDQPITTIEIREKPYHGFRTIVKSLLASGKDTESYLVRVQGFLFIVSKTQTYVEVVPLNPVLFANAYAEAQQDGMRVEFHPAAYQEQKTVSDRMFQALAGVYRKNEGHIKKMSYPCLYLEDDRVVLHDAFHRMRAYLMRSDHVDVRSPSLLMEVLSGKYPACRPFLDDLLDYYRHLKGEETRHPLANNLYRCLHQFMAQLLSGATHISLDDQRKHLGITVGIITRNRSADLKDLFDSLLKQVRSPDEVLVVDNGSTDQTRQVVEGFNHRIPISYCFLAEASIPNARNLVIEKAKNEIVAFTDDDCIPDPGWLEAVERGFLRADNIGIVGGWVKHEPAPRPSMIDTYYSLFHHNTT